MKKKNKFRVLLMCKKCNKVYNGIMPTNYERAILIYHNTMVNNKDVCKNKDCGELLLPVFEDMNT